MNLDELGNVVNHSGNSNETAAILGLILEVVPFHDWQSIEGNTPIELGALLIEFLLHLLNTAFLDFVLLELLQVEGKTHLLPRPNRPLGGIILMPFNSIPIVRGELVVKIVVAFPKSDKSGDDMVARGVAIIEGLVTEPMSERVHAERGLLNEEDPW